MKIDNKHRKMSYIVLIFSILLSLILYFFSPLSLLLPFIIFPSYYFYPLYKFEKQKYKDKENSFYLSLLIASYSFIYRDVFNSVVKSLKIFNEKDSILLKRLRDEVWKYLSSPSGKDLLSLFNKENIKEIDPSFYDVISLIKSSLKEKERTLVSIKEALTFHSNSIFSEIINKSRKSVNPIRIVFAILVVFPVFLLILLPLAVLFLPDIVNNQNLFLLFNIIIPFVALISISWYSIHLITKPSFNSFRSRKVQYSLSLLVILLLFSTITSLFFNNSFYVILSFFIFSILNFGFLFTFYRDYISKLLENYSLMEKLPAFFVLLAKELSKGVPFERAMINAEKKESLDIKSYFFILGKDKLKTSSLLSSYSNFITILKEASKKNIAKEISEVIIHFLNLKKEAEEKIRFINEETYHSAKLLIILVIPLISAVSSAFSDSLGVMLNVFSFANLSFIDSISQTSLLTYILTLYTLEMIAILTLFTTKLEGIGDIFYYLYTLGKNMLIAFSTFLLTYLLTIYFINIGFVVS